MANELAIHSVGPSLATYLRNTYPGELRAAHPCEFQLFASAEMGSTEERGTTLSLYLYRITMNEHVRNVRGTCLGWRIQQLAFWYCLARSWSCLFTKESADLIQ